MSTLRKYLIDNKLIAGASSNAPGLDDVAGFGANVTEAAAEATKYAGTVGFYAGGAGLVLQVYSNLKALGQGYLEARELEKSRSTTRGFAQGFLAGLLGWSWSQVQEHFAIGKVIHKNHFDGQMDVIEMKAYNRGLAAGHGYGAAAPDRKAFLSEIKGFASVPAPKAWNGPENRMNRIGYVIELAAAFQKHWLKSSSVALSGIYAQ